MIHSVATVARHWFLDAEVAQVVAEADPFTIVIGNGRYVSTSSADAFVAAVREAQGGEAASQSIRLREIARLRAISDFGFNHSMAARSALEGFRKFTGCGKYDITCNL